MSDPKPLPPQETLLRHFSYDRASGDLRWRVPTSNRVRVGDLIHCTSDQGRLKLRFQGQIYVAARIIWKMETGEEPESVDHRDRDFLNNRWENLRAADRSLQMLNRGSRNPLGKGIGQTRAGKFTANFFIRLGPFDTLEEAIEARDKKAAELHGDRWAP